MQLLDPTLDLEAFFARVARRPRLLFLDYDGTLAPFREDPGKAAPYRGVRARLQRLQAGGHTRVVLVTGRPARDLVPLLQLRELPEIWGSHGWERIRRGGESGALLLPGAARRDLQEARARLGEVRAAGGRWEEKPAGLAIHWRGLPGERVEAIRAVVCAGWADLAARGNLRWHDFDGGIELRVPGRDKGVVVDTVLAESDAGCAAAFLGDDFTDEDAFRAIRGRGLGVLVRTELRGTAAAVWLRPPGELFDFLDRWLAAGQGDCT